MYYIKAHRNKRPTDLNGKTQTRARATHLVCPPIAPFTDYSHHHHHTHAYARLFKEPARGRLLPVFPPLKPALLTHTQQSDRKADSPSTTRRDQSPYAMHQLPPLSLLVALLPLLSSGSNGTASLTRAVHAPVASSRIGAAGLWLERCELVSTCPLPWSLPPSSLVHLPFAN